MDLSALESSSTELGARLRGLPVAMHVLPFIDFSLPSSQRFAQAELHVVEALPHAGKQQ